MTNDSILSSSIIYFSDNANTKYLWMASSSIKKRPEKVDCLKGKLTPTTYCFGKTKPNHIRYRTFWKKCMIPYERGSVA